MPTNPLRFVKMGGGANELAIVIVIAPRLFSGVKRRRTSNPAVTGIESYYTMKLKPCDIREAGICSQR
jgi:hypothetical protein